MKKYNESLSEKFIRYGKAIINIFKDKGFSKIKFESGKDVYDFIIDYQKNIKRGKLSERAIEMAKTRTGVDGIQKLSKNIVAENKRLSEQLKTATAQEAIDIKNDLALNNEGILNDFVNSKKLNSKLSEGDTIFMDLDKKTVYHIQENGYPYVVRQ